MTSNTSMRIGRPVGALPMNEPVLRAGGDHAQPDGVAVGDEIFDREAEVGERAAQRLDDGPRALGAGSVIRAEVLVLDQLGRGERVHDL